MSLSDDLKSQKNKLIKAKTEQAKSEKSQAKRTRRAGKEWSKDDELIALYLYRSEASRFLRDNYAEKRELSSRAMALKISTFESIRNGNMTSGVSDQTKGLFKEFGRTDIKELEQKVIAILRGELTLSDAPAAE